MTSRQLHKVAIKLVRRLTFARTAAPEGGARRRLRHWVRGCAFLTILAAPVTAQEVPSGQTLALHEVLVDAVESESWLRFRFVAPQIAREGGDVSYAQAEADFAHLCETVARPYMREYDLGADVIVVTLMDRPVPFGQSDAAATQFIEAFRIADDACIWEAF